MVTRYDPSVGNDLDRAPVCHTTYTKSMKCRTGCDFYQVDDVDVDHDMIPMIAAVTVTAMNGL